MKKGLKILMVVVIAGMLVLGGAIYTILRGEDYSTLSLMKTTFAEEVLQSNNNPKGIHFKVLGPGIIEEVLNRLNLSEDELKTYWDQGKTLLNYTQDKGITKEKLIATFKAVITEKLDQLVSEGKITETEKNNLLVDIETRIEEFITKTPPFKNGKGKQPIEPPFKNGNGRGTTPGEPPFKGTPPEDMPKGKGFLFDGKGLMEDVLNKLNLSLDEFQNAMKEKKSLLEFAESKDITKENLIKVVKEVVTEKINQLVKDGKMTEDEKTKFLENLDEFVERFINGPGYVRGKGGPHGNGFRGNCDASPSYSNI